MRPAPLIALCALCMLCTCAALSSAPALGASPARVSAHHRKARAHHRKARSRHRRTASCAKRASYQATRGHSRRRSALCTQPSARPKRRHVRTRARSRHSKAHTHHPGSTHRKSRAHRKSRVHRKSRQKSTPALLVPLPVNGRCANSTLSPTEHDLGPIRTAVLCLINRERGEHGERPLVPNIRLERAAQGHTESMAFGDYFEHVGPRGETPLTRMRAAGYIYSSQLGYEVGENIGWGTLWLGTPREVVAAWMASPGHRANILDAHFRDTGIGVSPHPPSCVAAGQTGAVYTEDFGVIIS